jgi:hypothetical protein
MPLEKGKSETVIGHNITRERAAGKPERQAIAIAESEARRTGRDMQAPLATTASSGAPSRSRSYSDAWPGRKI